MKRRFRGVVRVKRFGGDLARAGGALLASGALAALSVVASAEMRARGWLIDTPAGPALAAFRTDADDPRESGRFEQAALGGMLRAGAPDLSELARAGGLALLARRQDARPAPAPFADFPDVALAACRGGEGGFRNARGEALAGLRIDGAGPSYRFEIAGPDGLRARDADFDRLVTVETEPGALVLNFDGGERMDIPCAAPDRAAVALEGDLVSRRLEGVARASMRPERLALTPLSMSPVRLALELDVRPRSGPGTPQRLAQPPAVFDTVAQAADGVAPAQWRHAVSLGTRAFSACLESACAPDAPLWSAWAAELSGLPMAARLERANRLVNTAMAFRTDLRRTRLPDSWITPEELFAAREGDCEDFALAKYWLLREAGVPAEDLYVMVVRDLAANVPHAFLAVRANGELFILDSRTPDVLRPEDLDAIQPVVTVTAQRNYVHGFEASAL